MEMCPEGWKSHAALLGNLPGIWYTCFPLSWGETSPRIAPEVRTADACQHDANDSVSRRFDGRVWSLARLNSALSLEYCSFHNDSPTFFCSEIGHSLEMF